MKSGVCDIEEALLIVRGSAPVRSERLRRELAELVACRRARPEGFLVGPQRDYQRLCLVGTPESNQPAEAGAVPEPGQELVTDDLEAEVCLLYTLTLPTKLEV
jgi:hypothetical protein